jgi:hypothetical protein
LDISDGSSIIRLLQRYLSISFCYASLIVRYVSSSAIFSRLHIHLIGLAHRLEHLALNGDLVTLGLSRSSFGPKDTAKGARPQAYHANRGRITHGELS